MLQQMNVGSILVFEVVACQGIPGVLSGIKSICFPT